MKKLKKDIVGITKSGMTLGVGSIAIEGVGGSAAPLTAVGGYMPTIGTMTGASATMRHMKKLKLK